MQDMLLYVLFSSIRSVDGFSEMVCKLPIDRNLLTRPLAYKYVIFSPKMTEKDDCYEFLHCYTSYHESNPNRCLWIHLHSLIGSTYIYNVTLEK